MACAGSALGMPLNSSARTVVPADLQQLISVDYRALRDSATAVALKRQLMDSQKNLEEFEGALRGIGINPDKDIDTLALASFRTPKQGVQTIGVAGGPYNIKAVLKKLTAAKIKPTKYHDTSNIYPMDGGFVMTFLDDSTLMFGEPGAVRSGLDARDGYIPNLDTNETMSDMMTSVDSSPFWSILDQQGTQNMMRSALGDAARIADYETVKKRVLGSYYTMDFSSGVDFQLTVVTSDSMSAGTLSMLLKAAILFMKASATPVEKAAMDQAAIDSDGQNMTVHFKDSDAQFQSLMHSQLFASLSH
ncbi:MAG TPA: hypothetical protein VMU61_05790 [Candidatus Aquilonibacter sp.]|nr:hypothetical protein [Candidatus Aquilonibacter sp.]